jgi:hypothetical protein
MMLTAVLTGLLIQSVSLIYAFSLGMRWIQPGEGFHSHVVAALIATLISLFVQTVVFFYTMASGRRAMDLVAAGEWAEGKTKESQEIRDHMKEIKKSIYPWVGLHLIVLFATFWAGAAFQTFLIPRSIHSLLANATLATGFIAIYQAYRWIPSNEVLMDNAWFRFRKYEAPDEARGGKDSEDWDIDEEELANDPNHLPSSS